jgi:hypothetical protein
MRNHTLNLFKIQNLSNLNFSYRLADFDLPIIDGQEDRLNKQLQKIALKVASLSGGPTAIIKVGNKFQVAIPQDKTFPETVVNVAPMNVKVKLLPELHYLHFSMVGDDNFEIVQKFLDFEIRKQLSKYNDIWKLNSSQFFLKKPKVESGDSGIGVFEGFNYKLIRLEDGNFYISLDLSTKYIDKHPLSYYINTKNADIIGSSYKGRRCLYLNSDNWYAVEVVGFGNPVQEHLFEYNGKEHNVYDYILDNAGKRANDVKKVMKPTDLCLLYKYPKRSMEPHSGCASLAKIVYNTHDKEVQSLHRQSIKKPGHRFESIQNYIKQYFKTLNFNGKSLNISMRPVEEQIHNFAFPDLKFNNGKILKVGRSSSAGETPLRDFGLERKKLIELNGVLTNTIFDEQFLVVPDYLDKKLVEAFKKNAEYQIGKLAPIFKGFKIIRYKVQTNHSASQQMQEIERVLQLNNAMDGFALFILPDITFDSRQYIRNFHDSLKNRFYPNLKVQCASAHKIKSYFRSFPVNGSINEGTEFKVPENDKYRFRSYLFNLVMEHLIVNRKWPFSLSKNLHYDIYIGIDVHDRFAGFTFFFRNGEKILFFPVAVPQKNRSQRAEKLKAGLLYTMIYDKLKEYIPMFCQNPNGIIILRDGRSFGEEEKALRDVIKSLDEDGLVEKEKIKSGVIDLHKQSAVPLRIALQTNSFDSLENPIAGTYKLINHKEGFIYNTGYPFQIPGSAKPLNLSLKSGNINFLMVLEDIFCQSMLAFSAPDRSNSLPVTIKLIDTLLEPLSNTFEPVEEDEDFEDSIIENH